MLRSQAVAVTSEFHFVTDTSHIRCPYAPCVSATALRSRPDSRLGRSPAAIIFIAAAAIQIAYILIFLRHYHMEADAQHYHDIAINVAHGHGFAAHYPYLVTHPTAFRPPLYPLLLGGTYAVFGDHIASAQILNVVLGSAVVVLVAVLATRIGGRRAGLIAAALTAVFPPLLANDGVPLSEPLGLVVMLLGIWALLAGRPGWAGIAVGLLVLTRPSAQLLVPVLALVIWRQIGFRRAVLFCLASVIVVAPWVIRNESIFHRPVIVTSNGFNLAAIYSPMSLKAGHFLDPVFDPSFAPVENYAHSWANFNEANLDSAFRREGLKGIREDPGRVPYVISLNIRRLVDQTWRLNDGPEAQDGRPLRLRHWTLPLVWSVEILGLLGLIRMTRIARREYRSRGRESRAPAALGEGVIPLVAGYFFVVSVLTVSVPRLRAPDDALMIIAIGVWAAALWARRGAQSPLPAPESGQSAQHQQEARGSLPSAR